MLCDEGIKSTTPSGVSCWLAAWRSIIRTRIRRRTGSVTNPGRRLFERHSFRLSMASWDVRSRCTHSVGPACKTNLSDPRAFVTSQNYQGIELQVKLKSDPYCREFSDSRLTVCGWSPQLNNSNNRFTTIYSLILTCVSEIGYNYHFIRIRLPVTLRSPPVLIRQLNLKVTSFLMHM